MEFEIIGRHTEVTEPVKQYLAEKRDKLAKFFDRIHSLRVIISPDGADHVAEFVAHLVKSDMVIAKGHAPDLFAAIDQASDKMEAQLRKYKGKLREHRLKADEGAPERREAAEEDT